MKRRGLISALFWLAAAYDGLLGLAFLFFPAAVLDMVGAVAPSHIAYIQFPAALLIVFALMFAAVARRPRENRNLIVYGILLKVSYCGVVFWHWIATDITHIWKPFAVADLGFAALFAAAYVMLKRT